MLDGKKKKILIVLAVFACILFILFLFFRYVNELGNWRGTSFDKYLKRAYKGVFFQNRELPKGAYDFKFQCTNLGLAQQSFAGFNLSGDDYDDYVASLKELEEPTELAKEKFIGKKVSDTYDYYNDDGFNGYTGFPKKNLRYTAEGDIADYTILYYNVYRGHRLEANAVLVNSATGRFIIYCEGSN